MLENIAVHKAAGEAMRLELHAEFEGWRKVIVLQRTMNSPVCTICVGATTEENTPVQQQEAGGHTAYVRARLPVVTDALYLALTESFFFCMSDEMGMHTKGTATLHLAGQVWACARLQMNVGVFDAEEENEADFEEQEVQLQEWAQEQSGELLSHPMVARMLRVLCENTALL